MNEIQIVKEFVSSNAFDKDRFLSIIESFGKDIALIPLVLQKGQKMIRTRLNENDMFYNIAELSYPPVACANRTDRASLKGHPMFYASVFTKDAQKTGCLPRIVSAFETIELLKQKHTTNQAFFTQSVWFVEQPVHIFAFPISNKYKRSCSELNMFKEGWDSFCKDHFSGRSIEFFSYIGDLMATAQKSCIYDITATCVDYIIRNMGYEGIVYPSVPTEGEGLNICLTPQVVDTKISFGDAIVEVVFRHDMKSEIVSFAHAKMVSPSSFVWVVSKHGKHIMQITKLFPVFNPEDEIILYQGSAFKF